MGVSTDGQICFGNVYEDGFEFPWDAGDGDLEDWWRKQNGFDQSKDYPAEGWLEYGKEFEAAHPCPVELVNYCSGEYPMWMLAVPSTCKSSSRGYPEKFQPSELVVPEAELKAFHDFCIKYDLVPEEDAAWYLTSYWG